MFSFLYHLLIFSVQSSYRLSNQEIDPCEGRRERSQELLQGKQVDELFTSLLAREGKIHDTLKSSSLVYERSYTILPFEVVGEKKDAYIMNSIKIGGNK